MVSSAPGVPLPLPLGGVRADLEQREVPPNALIDAENWMSRKGIFTVRPGLTALGAGGDALVARVMGFIEYEHEEEKHRLVLGSTAGWRWYDSGADVWVDISGGAPLSGSQLSHVLFRTFEQGGVTYLLGVNASDTPKVWDGDTAGAYRDMGGSPPHASGIALANNRCLLSIDNMVYVSSDLDFDAGYLTEPINPIVLGETPGTIVGLREVGNTVTLAYKARAIHALSAQDDAVHPFRNDVVKEGILGPVSPRAIIALPSGEHCYLAETGDVFAFDGVVPRTIGPNEGRPIRDYIASRADFDLIGRSWGMWDGTHGSLLFFFPTTNAADITTGVAIQYPEGQVRPVRYAIAVTAGLNPNVPSSITVGDLTMPIGSIDIPIGELTQSQRSLVFGSADGPVYTGTGYTDAGTPVPHFFQTGLLGDQNARRWTWLHEVELFLSGGGGEPTLTVEAHGSDYGEDPSLLASDEVQVGVTGPFVAEFRNQSRKFSLRVSGECSSKLEWHGAQAAMSQGPTR